MQNNFARDLFDLIAPKHEYTCVAMRNCEDGHGGITQEPVTKKVCAHKGESWLVAFKRMDRERPECGHVQVGVCETHTIVDVCLD